MAVKRNTVIVPERSLIMSKAFREPRTAVPHFALMIFISKRQMTRIGHQIRGG